MYLSEFRIKNFRSIIDSDWNSLSSDNITALIGQNESGKTSVLEALYSFYEGSINEDVLRSDLSMPEVSCSFTIDDKTLNSLDVSRMPPEVIAAISEKNKVVITRKWLPDLTTQIYMSGNPVTDIFDKIEATELQLISAVLKEVRELIDRQNDYRNEITGFEDNILSYKSEIERIRKKQNDLIKLYRRSSDPAKKELLKQSSDSAQTEYDQMSEMLTGEQESLIRKQTMLSGIDKVCDIGAKCLEMSADFEQIKIDLENAYRNQAIIENNLAFLKEEKEKKAGNMKLFQAKENYIIKSHEFDLLKEKTGITIRVIQHMIDGKDQASAERDARCEYGASNKFLTREEAGELLFQLVPRYEFFEDFSSLLPNRIDLEDIFEDNNRVEGYKAVRNFLRIAGLDPEFFRQTNSRILKQKIENLNNEVTIDFQEYWRQNVGKTNKIRIHFELEHYDISHPEKKGKPYLEFWIKDEFERLYPKQRSRGVRWFLSFYLELKAFSRENENKSRVLLIDEPGLSLHACAQEDVLKVFEDIRAEIQIIYTTHSPHLIDHNKLYRLLAAQRANDDGEKSETRIIDASRLHAATSDTLSPVSSIMGASFPRQQLMMQNKNNVIVEDISSFYYLSTLYRLQNGSSGLSFLPANNPAGVISIVNLLIGWGFDFSVMLFGNVLQSGCISELKMQFQVLDPDNSKSKLYISESKAGPEDLFSTLDFKKHIINKRVGISGTNSEFISNNDISRPLLAAGFARKVSSGILSMDDFDEETRNNIKEAFDSLSAIITIADET